FYAVLSLFPGAVAVVSLMSMIGIRAEAVDALASMVTEVFPSLDPRPFISAILAVTSTGGGMLGLTLGLAGSLLSASNGVAAFHRALHRVFDTPADGPRGPFHRGAECPQRPDRHPAAAVDRQHRDHLRCGPGRRVPARPADRLRPARLAHAPAGAARHPHHRLPGRRLRPGR